MADTHPPGTIRVVVVTPETTVLDVRARSVSLPLFDGERGVARGHAPFIGRIGAGEVRIVGETDQPSTATRKMFVEGGFVEVGQNAVTIVTQKAIPQEKFDAAKARADLEQLRATKAAGDEAIAAKLAAMEAARALLRSSGR